jgi:hypothetical protein
MTTYYYKVYAINAAGSSLSSNEVSATTPALPPPPAPSALMAIGISTSQINLTWSDNSNDESGFKIERATAAGGPFTTLSNLNAGVTNFSDTGIASYIRYYYRVSAIRGAVSSSFSNIANAAPLPPANTPAFVTSVQPIATGVRITTNGPVQGIRYFHDFSDGAIDVVGTPPYPGIYDIAIVFPQGTTFICVQVVGTDTIYQGAFVGDPQTCNSIP